MWTRTTRAPTETERAWLKGRRDVREPRPGLEATFFGGASWASQVDPTCDEVEVITGVASGASVLEHREGSSAFFLEVGTSEVLTVWDDGAELPKERVELVRAGGQPLSVRWEGAAIAPTLRGRFSPVEWEPASGDVLPCTLGALRSMLRDRGADRSSVPPLPLAKDVARLGFYAHVDPADVDSVRGLMVAAEAALDWYFAAHRLFDADPERLAEGGVTELLESMRPVLEREGVSFGPMEPRYHAEHGYSIRIGAERLVLWSEHEAAQSWELTTQRTVALVDGWLARASSGERLYGLGERYLVLLRPEVLDALEKSGVFRATELPRRPA